MMERNAKRALLRAWGQRQASHYCANARRQKMRRPFFGSCRPKPPCRLWTKAFALGWSRQDDTDPDDQVWLSVGHGWRTAWR